MGTSSELRWDLAEESLPQLTLFDDIPVRKVGRGEYRGLEFLEVRSKTLINEIPYGPMPFRFTINAYRGCSHACAYCFARPTHEYLGLDSGRDFDTKIVVKKNAVELVRAETNPVRWSGDGIAMGTNTDPYQPAEGKYRLTRGIVEVLVERENGFSVLTKSPLVLRDLDVYHEALARGVEFRIDFSIPTIDPDAWRLTEPGTPHPARRVEAVARLREAGITSGVLVGPILPGISDGRDQIRDVVRACVEAGASSIAPIALHLKPGVKEHYMGWLDRHRPDLIDLHSSRYGGRSFAPAPVRTMLARRVRRLIDEIAPAGHPARRPWRTGDTVPGRKASHDQQAMQFDHR